MENDNLKLIYINPIGQNTEKEFMYEFIFGIVAKELIDYCDEWGWNETPASDWASPPPKDFYDKIETLKTIDFQVYSMHNNEFYSYLWGLHGTHAIGYTFPEIERDDFDYNDGSKNEITNFYYGESYESVLDKLNSKGCTFQKR